jgi:hypothetical protein
MVTQGEDGRYYKPCPECGIMQSYLRKNYAEQSLFLGKICKTCSNRKTDNSHRGWHRDIRISWYNRFKINAEMRGIFWDLTIDNIADLMESQDFRCALSGEPIEFPDFGNYQKSPASIDRIDSSKGYIKDNIQLVTRKVNMMKQSYSQEEFIEVCKKVAKYTEVKW